MRINCRKTNIVNIIATYQSLTPPCLLGQKCNLLCWRDPKIFLIFSKDISALLRNVHALLGGIVVLNRGRTRNETNMSLFRNKSNPPISIQGRHELPESMHLSMAQCTHLTTKKISPHHSVMVYMKKLLFV